ncbi:hypothetical protein [Oceanobacillus kapialis]|uniref:DUF3993 domain-containing protein n=1 Tax=Oceanobacillus kapialis TaxID=481353 RepID=A0ABW5Q018_9BACI
MKKLVQMTLITFTVPVLMICSILMTQEIEADPKTSSAKTHEVSNVEKAVKDVPQQQTLQDAQVKELTKEFMDTLVQPSDEKYKVKNMDSKAQLLSAFHSIAEEEMVKPFVDYYYTEEADGLYILPTETPPWFIADNQYDMVQLEDNVVKIIQSNETALHGAYTIEMKFTYDGTWKIASASIS